MNVSEALKNRKSVRAFLDREVSREQVIAILESARWAASGTNAQPWEVVVLSGKSKAALCREIEALFDGGTRGKMEYNYYPVEWKEPFKARRIACGMALYSALDIQRDDLERRKSQWAANYRAFDAPVVLLFLMDRILETGSYLDIGMFIQSVMLAALDQGLATCPQASLGEYPEAVKRHVGYGDSHVLVCGMALGYEDCSDPVNHYRTAREEVSAFTRFLS
ncbi:MAG: nitroreductase [Gammaproteobacteria bacterium]|nr:nitroreductase [Gammaproteobacteria bacterium]